MTIRPDSTFVVDRAGGAWRVRYDQRPLTIGFDTTHDVAAAALLCEATVITEDLNVRHACRALRVRVLWPEEVTT
jgi:hypothetical protein